jgi:hypothetical protein
LGDTNSQSITQVFLPHLSDQNIFTSYTNCKGGQASKEEETGVKPTRFPTRMTISVLININYFCLTTPLGKTEGVEGTQRQPLELATVIGAQDGQENRRI